MPKSTRTGPGAPPLHANVAELRALAHPLRLRMLELFAEAPRTTKQVADLLGEPPTRLYHHVAALERAGLLRLRETRKNRGTVEKWFETSARMFATQSKSTRRKNTDAQAQRAAALTILEQSKQEMLGAMTRGGETPLLARILVAAPPSTMQAVRQRLVDVINDLRRDTSEDNAAVERWAVTLAFAPVGAQKKPRR